MEIYHRLENPKLYAVIKAQTIGDDGVLADGALTDPGSVEVIIEDSTGVVTRTLVSMDKDADGKYSYEDYTIPADAMLGTWNWEIRGTTGSKVAIAGGSFIVKEQIA